MLSVIARRGLTTRVYNRLYSSANAATAKESYEKASETTPEPVTPYSGSRTYVVSEPDPQDKPYKVPSGAYASTSPYEPQQSASQPNPNDSSTSASQPHPTTTQYAPNNTSGVGSSSSVRFRSAPGDMKDGSDGGLGLMDKAGTKNLEQKGMASWNTQPKGE